MSRALSAPLLAAMVAIALALPGCGSGSSASSSTATATSPQSPQPTAAAKAAAKQAAGEAKAAEAKAPKGASPTLRAIYRQFPAPQAEAAQKGSATAIAAGQKACQGKTPSAVKEEFYPAAKASLEPEQAKMIARVGSYEKHASQDASFTAGQLAADTYAATLPEADSQAGYQGCVYALARGLERELGPHK
jgi:hypothetical protein